MNSDIDLLGGRKGSNWFLNVLSFYGEKTIPLVKLSYFIKYNKEHSINNIISFVKIILKKICSQQHNIFAIKVFQRIR